MTGARILLVTGSRALDGSAYEADAHALLRACAKMAAQYVSCRSCPEGRDRARMVANDNGRGGR